MAYGDVAPRPRARPIHMWHATAQEHEAAMTLEGWNALADRSKVAVLIDRMDGSRLWSFGGYPSDYAIVGNKVIWAEPDASKDYNRAVLNISTIKQFIKDHDWAVIER